MTATAIGKALGLREVQVTYTLNACTTRTYLHPIRHTFVTHVYDEMFSVILWMQLNDKHFSGDCACIFLVGTVCLYNHFEFIRQTYIEVNLTVLAGVEGC